MNEEDEIISARRFRSMHTSLESWDLSNESEPLPPKTRALKHPMSDDANRCGLRLAELFETTYSHTIRKRIRHGIVWQVVYSVRLTHPEGLAAFAPSSNHSEHIVVSSSPMTPYTH